MINWKRSCIYRHLGGGKGRVLGERNDRNALLLYGGRGLDPGRNGRDAGATKIYIDR